MIFFLNSSLSSYAHWKSGQHPIPQGNSHPGIAVKSGKEGVEGQGLEAPHQVHQQLHFIKTSNETH